MNVIIGPIPSGGVSLHRPRLRHSILACLLLATSTPAADNARWATYHNDAGLRGHTSQSLSLPLVRLWRFNAGAPVAATPVAGPRLIYLATEKGSVMALDDTGARVWARTLQAPAITNRPPAAETFDAPLLFADNIVFAGSRGGRLHALDGDSGGILWSYALPGAIRGTPAFRKEAHSACVLVLDQADGAIHSLDARTGKAQWTSEPAGRTDGSFSLGGDRLVFGNCNSALYAMSAANGRQQASVPLGENAQVAGGVATDGDLAFTGNRNGTVYCINLANSTIVWSNAVSTAEVFTTPALGAEVLVVGAGDGNVFALDRKTGATRWTFETRGEPTSPVIAADKVLIASGGVLHLLKLADGAALWSSTVSDEISSPAVIDGRIIVSGSDGYVTAFGPAPAVAPDANPKGK